MSNYEQMMVCYFALSWTLNIKFMLLRQFISELQTIEFVEKKMQQILKMLAFQYLNL